MGYLDNAGLTYLWTKVKAALAVKQNTADALTMEQVNEAINAAITGAMADVY